MGKKIRNQQIGKSYWHQGCGFFESQMKSWWIWTFSWTLELQEADLWVRFFCPNLGICDGSVYIYASFLDFSYKQWKEWCYYAWSGCAWLWEMLNDGIDIRLDELQPWQFSTGFILCNVLLSVEFSMASLQVDLFLVVCFSDSWFCYKRQNRYSSDKTTI